MAQALGNAVGTLGDVCLLHDGHDTSPGGGAGPGPQRLLEFAPPVPSLDFFEAVYHVEGVQQGGGYQYCAVHTFAAFFEAFHNDHLVGKIPPSGGEVEGFRNTAPRVIQETAKGAHGPIVPQRGAEKRVALPRGEVCQLPTNFVLEPLGVC